MNDGTSTLEVRRSARCGRTAWIEEENQLIRQGINSGIDQNLAVEYFSEKGRGVVAVKDFQKGEFVVEYSGELIHHKEAKLREKNMRLRMLVALCIT